MSLISKSEWQDWKSNNVTQAFFEAASIRIEDAIEILSNTAGLNPDEDNFCRGFIRAYREMQEFQIEDLVND